MSYPSLVLVFCLFATCHYAFATDCGKKGVAQWIEASDALQPGKREQLAKISSSPIVEKALLDEESVYFQVYRKLLELDAGSHVSLNTNDARFLVIGAAGIEDGAMTVSIKSIKIADKVMGESSKGINTAFYKLIGSVIRGIEKKVRLSQNQIRKVRIIGQTVVNPRLMETLENFGFRPELNKPASFQQRPLGVDWILEVNVSP